MSDDLKTQILKDLREKMGKEIAHSTADYVRLAVTMECDQTQLCKLLLETLAQAVAKYAAVLTTATPEQVGAQMTLTMRAVLKDQIEDVRKYETLLFGKAER